MLKIIVAKVFIYLMKEIMGERKEWWIIMGALSKFALSFSLVCHFTFHVFGSSASTHAPLGRVTALPHLLSI